jgi:hypothetical protein
MNQGHVAQIQSHIDKYFQLDLAALIAATYPEVDANHFVIGEYSIKEFLSISNKVFSQFREELGGAYIKSLPFQYHFHNEFGAGDLHSDLANFLAYIETKRFAEALPYMARLIHYQAINGFWEKSKRKYFKASEEALRTDRERIDLVSNQLNSATEKLRDLLADLEVSKESLTSFTSTKQKELGEIESLLVSARNHNSEITELHSTSTATAEKINSLLTNADEKKQEAETLQKESRTELTKVKLTLEKHAETIEVQNSDYQHLKESFEQKLEFVDEKHQHFIERNNYLNDLIGREVGVSLFETFKQRKNELNASITFWKWAVPITAAATILWIFILFGNGNLEDLKWQIILINSIKTLPALGLLLFSISQYTKERNFQEEYAFKSAVALTVNAYAEQLISDENKDALIMNSVNSIYKSPAATKNLKAIDEKALLSTVKDLSETVKSFSQNK